MNCKGLLKRNVKECLRDPLTLTLGLAFPVFLLILFFIIDKSVDMDIDMFSPATLTPGVVVFGFSTLMMSEGNLICSDRNSSLFSRFRTLPLRATDYMIAYTLPFLAMTFGQYVVTFALAFCFGLNWTPHVFTCVLLLFPVAVIFVSVGMLMGFTLNAGQLTGIGNGLITVIAILSGAWFPVEVVGGGFEIFATILPFYNAVTLSRQLLQGLDFEWYRLGILLAYAVVLAVLSVVVTAKRLKKA